VTGHSSATPDDRDLVHAAQAGDRPAFGLLYERYVRLVHGILLARVPFAAVDDLVHDVFLQALSRLGSLRDTSRFGPWVAAMARNRAADFHRERPDEVEWNDETGAQTREMGPGPDALAVLAVIRELPEAYRETLMLRLVEGMTGPEIAQRTGLTPGSVRVNLHRGMQQLREKLSEQKCKTEKKS